MMIYGFNKEEKGCVSEVLNDKLSGIQSGFAELDSITGGFRKSEFIIIGSRPSEGKTAFALSVVNNTCVEKNIPCAFLSLEMSSNMICQRLLRLCTDTEKLDNAPLYILDFPSIQISKLCENIKWFVVAKNLQIVFIDFIGLISTENPDAPVYEQMSLISHSLKSLAKELEIPIVGLCQVHGIGYEEPNLAQLRGSGSIEQDADVVLLLHRKKIERDEQSSVQDTKFLVAKNRNGATGEVALKFNSKFVRIES